jgi:translation initiation factor 2B subunit (eIF-2B alpha/beta/delta family)
MDYEEQLKDIINDKKSGSSIIARKIKNLFPKIPEDKKGNFIKKILKAHSSMGAVINQINILCLKNEGFEINEKKDNREKIFDKFWKENGKFKNWITLSMSYWVIELFKHGKNRLNIKVAVSYPDKEGLITYNLLAKYHNMAVYEDSRLPNEVKDADGIILGADLMTEKFIINKIGSFPLALAAKYYNKPLYIISSGDKYLTEDLLGFFKVKRKGRGNRIIDIYEDIPVELINNIYITSLIYKYPVSECLKKFKA